jgi:Family of unknown function (DUF6263)
MKIFSIKYIVAGAVVFTGFTAMAQKASSIRLQKGDNITITNTAKVTSTVNYMGQDMEMGGDIVSANTIKVDAAKGNAYDMTTTLSKVKLNMSALGQELAYDSENPGAGDERLAGAFKDKLNKPAAVTIGGDGVVLASPADESAEASPMLAMLGDAGRMSEGDIVASAFFLIPEASKMAGASWSSDASKGEDVKIVYNYTLKEIKDGHALVIVKSENALKMKAMQMGMETTTSVKGGGEGEILVELSSGLVKKRTMLITMTGNVDAAGMQIPIKMVTSNITDISKQ